MVVLAEETSDALEQLPDRFRYCRNHWTIARWGKLWMSVYLKMQAERAHTIKIGFASC